MRVHHICFDLKDQCLKKVVEEPMTKEERMKLYELDVNAYTEVVFRKEARDKDGTHYLLDVEKRKGGWYQIIRKLEKNVHRYLYNQNLSEELKNNFWIDDLLELPFCAICRMKTLNNVVKAKRPLFGGGYLFSMDQPCRICYAQFMHREHTEYIDPVNRQKIAKRRARDSEVCAA